MASIFEIAQDMRALDDLMTESGGDISDPMAAEAIDAFFAELEGDLEAKVENYLRLVKELEARADARRSEADRIRNRAKVDENSAKALKRRLTDSLDMIGRTRIETPTFKVTVSSSGGKAPVSIDPDAVTEEFMREVRTHVPDKERIREALESGRALTFASLTERSRTLRIS